MIGRRPLVLLVLAALVVMAGTACDGDDRRADTAPEADVLSLRFDDGRGGVIERSVACADAPALCAEVARILDAPPDEVCTQIYGGPQSIRVRGTREGRAVDLTITRADGCQIARYDRVMAALPTGGG